MLSAATPARYRLVARSLAHTPRVLASLVALHPPPVSPHRGWWDHRHHAWGHPYHTSSVRGSDAEAAAPIAAQDDAPPPIVWTTHRLSAEQIAKVDALFHKILWLDLFETQMLIDLLNYRLGYVMTPKQRLALERQLDAIIMGGSANAAVGGGGDAGQDDQVAEDEGPKAVDIKLTAFDAKAKIKIIKEVRAIAGLGLKEAKELVEAAPKVIQSGVAPEEAEAFKAKLEELGATVELV